MICAHCQREIADNSNFCYFCGATQRVAPPPSAAPRPAKRLMRSSTDVKIAGVCAGIADYLDIDPTVARLVWVVLSIVPGGFVGGILVYLLAWIIMPIAPAAAPVQVQPASPQVTPSH